MLTRLVNIVAAVDHDADRKTDAAPARLDQRTAIRSELVHCEQRQDRAPQLKRCEILIVDDQRPAEPPVEISQGWDTVCAQTNDIGDRWR